MKQILAALLVLGIVWPDAALGASRLMPEDLVYQGAFRLPDVPGDCDWTYSGHGMTYYPDGDPGGDLDGYPGSLFATGNDANCQFVSEISIPAPVISAGKNLADLPVATTLQPFADIRAGLFGAYGDMTLPRAGLAYLPPMAGQSRGKLHFCWGEHIQEFAASHGWCELDLSAPHSRGIWYFGDWTNYVSNDYLFTIPTDWADAYTGGQYLASGRAREGPWSGLGPALFSYAPWQDGLPPPANTRLSHITPLLLYGTQDPGTPEIVTDPEHQMNGHGDADHLESGAWLTPGNKTAVIFVGTKAVGNSWYGFANGVVWPYNCSDPETPPCPPVPPWPYDDRGFWADDYSARILFFDPRDLAAVALGLSATWDPQPYAQLNLDSVLFDPNVVPARYKRDMVMGVAYDRERGYLYVTERQVEEEKSIVHVWSVGRHRPNDLLPPNEWRQISLPASPGAGDTVLDLFPTMPGAYGTDWLLYEYDPVNNIYRRPGPSASLRQGVGYWIIQFSDHDVRLNLAGSTSQTPVLPAGECPTGSPCFSIDLATRAGEIQWSMLGYPFTRATSLHHWRVVTSSGTCADADGCTLAEAREANIFHSQLWSYTGASGYEGREGIDYAASWSGFWGATMSGAHGLNPRLMIPRNSLEP